MTIVIFTEGSNWAYTILGVGSETLGKVVLKTYLVHSTREAQKTAFWTKYNACLASSQMLVLLLDLQNRARKNRPFYFSFLPFQPGLYGTSKEYCLGLISFKKETVRFVCMFWTSLGCNSLTCTSAAWRFLEIPVSFLFPYDIRPKCPYILATFVFFTQANSYQIECVDCLHGQT